VSCDPLGEMEIATLLGVQPDTVRMWRKRGRLPEPDGRVSGMPYWFRATVLAWAAATGRLG
jgi:MerR HTH family regulatory protein